MTSKTRPRNRAFSVAGAIILLALSGCLTTPGDPPDYASFTATYRNDIGQEYKIAFGERVMTAAATGQVVEAYLLELAGPRETFRLFVDADMRVMRIDQPCVDEKCLKSNAYFPRSQWPAPFDIGTKGQATTTVLDYGWATEISRTTNGTQVVIEHERPRDYLVIAVAGTFQLDGKHAPAAMTVRWPGSTEPVNLTRTHVEARGPLEPISPWPGPPASIPAAGPLPPGTDKPYLDEEWTIQDGWEFLLEDSPEAAQHFTSGCLAGLRVQILPHVQPGGLGDGIGEPLDIDAIEFTLLNDGGAHSYFAQYGGDILMEQMLGQERSWRSSEGSEFDTRLTCASKPLAADQASITNWLSHMEQQIEVKEFLLAASYRVQGGMGAWWHPHPEIGTAEYSLAYAPPGASPGGVSWAYDVRYDASNQQFIQLHVHPEDLARFDQGLWPI